MPQRWDMGQIVSLPLRRRACGGFFRCPKKNPRTRVPEASMLTASPPRPSYRRVSRLCSHTSGHGVVRHTVGMYSWICTVRSAVWCRVCDVLATSLSCCLHRIRAQTFVHRKLQRVIVLRETFFSLLSPTSSS